MHRSIFGSRSPDTGALPPDPRESLLRAPHVTRFVIASLCLHLLFIAAAIRVTSKADLSLPSLTPVNIVNLPKNVLAKLPPVEARPIPQPVVPIPKSRKLTPFENAAPQDLTSKKSPAITLPKTSPPSGQPDGAKSAPDAGKPDTRDGVRGKSSLPFLSQKDIDELAQKGFPKWKLKDDPLTQETEGFKYYGYTKWFFAKANQFLRYPELAAASGLQGDVFINIVLLKDGIIGDIDVVKSSGYKILDDEVVRALRASGPHQPLPDDWNTDHYTIPIVGSFRIYYRELR